MVEENIYKDVNDLCIGDILKFKKDNKFYKILGWFSEDKKDAKMKDCYFNFGSFIVHGKVLNHYFATYSESLNSKKKLILFN